MEIIKQPAAVSLAGNMQRIVIAAASDISFILYVMNGNNTKEAVVKHTYTPNDNGQVEIDVSSIVLPFLSFSLKDGSEPYRQSGIVRDFVAEVDMPMPNSAEPVLKSCAFRVIRAGIDMFDGDVLSFLRQNFLTWQPTLKHVTYHTPEFLTFYAVDNATVRCRAYRTEQDFEEFKLAEIPAGQCWTIPVQYACIAAKIKGALPGYYDVWVENDERNRTSYVQRYCASDMLSEEEQWILFENSLGGIDTFRAYGDSANEAEHTHNLAEIDETFEEYRVDTARKFKKNTGFLGKNERVWLLDFFPSRGKYIYVADSLRRIVLTDSDVNYNARQLPSNYSFTYKYADSRPYLNIPRTDKPQGVLNISVPEMGSFTVAPRLVEFPRTKLSGGALFPMQNPYSEQWTVTTVAALLEYFIAVIGTNHAGDGGIGHRHHNIDLLESLSLIDGYLLTELNKIKAGYADKAHDLDDDSPANKRFLSALVDDVAAGNITFRQAIYVLGVSVFKGGAQFGEFVKSMYDGKGAGIDEHGNAEFESVRVRTYFEAVELIINRLSAIEGDQVLTESDTIDSVDNLGNSCYGLHLHPKWEGYFTAISQGSVLKGIVNNLGAVALGMSGQGGLKEYTSWMRVNSVNAAGNYIEVTVYPDEDTPARRNFPPCELMKVARWGHQTDEKRQSCIYLSSTEGRIVKLTGVTKPIIDRTNYGAVFGTLPEFVKTLTDNEGNPLPLREGFDYMYIPGIVTQDIVRIDWQGRPVVNYVDCGQWVAGKNYFCEALNPDSGIYETNDVWHIGCKYRCMKNLTKVAPAWNTPDWAMIEGNPAFGVEFEDTDTLFDPDKFDVTLKILAKMFNQDVTDDILDADVQWTRYSEDANGVERVASDNAWAIRRAGAGKAMHLTLDDIDMLGYMPRVTRFTATVTLRDGMGKAAKKGVAIFEN